jgi:ABC-2 type transport system permease protein
MILLAVARKTLREYWREPALAGILLAAPVVLVWLFYAVYAPVKDHLGDLARVAVLDQDAGPRGAELAAAVRGIQFDGQPAVSVSPARARQESEVALREGKIALLLVIPPNFTAGLEAARDGRQLGIPPTVEYAGDTASFNYVFTRSIIDETVRAFIRTAAGLGAPRPTRYEFLPGTGTSADFDFSVPGLLVFSMTMLIISTAITLVREHRSGALGRVRLAGVPAAAFLAGIGMAQAALAVGIIALGFGAAIALGFGRGSDLLAPGRVAWLLAVSQLYGIACIGFGMLTAAFSRSDGDAANIGSLLMVPLVFLSGMLFPLPPVPLFTLGGTVIGLYDLLPSTLAAEIIRRAVCLGEPPSAFAVQGVVMLAEVAITLAACGLAYRWRRLPRA